MGRDNSIGIVTRYGLSGSGIETKYGGEFLHQSRTALGPDSASYAVGTGTFHGEKLQGRGIDHPPHIALRLRKE